MSWQSIHRRLAWIERRLRRPRRAAEQAALEEERFDLMAMLDEMAARH